MSNRAPAINQTIAPIYRWETVVIDFTPPVGSSYDLSTSTFFFAVGVTPEVPTVTVSSTPTSLGGITVVSSTTIEVTIDQSAMAMLNAGPNYWTLYEIIASKDRVIAAGAVEVRQPAGIPS